MILRDLGLLPSRVGEVDWNEVNYFSEKRSKEWTFLKEKEKIRTLEKLEHSTLIFFKG